MSLTKGRTGAACEIYPGPEGFPGDPYEDRIVHDYNIILNDPGGIHYM